MSERPVDADDEAERPFTMTARQQMTLEASAMACDETRWHSRRKSELVCWDEMRLQFARGFMLVEIARQFGVAARSVQQRKSEEAWSATMTAAEREALSRVISMAKDIRRGMIAPRPGYAKARPSRAAPRARPVAPQDAATALMAPVDPTPAKPWREVAHAAQLPPERAWRTWMLMGGRGAGKTRAGAEWVRGLVEAGMAKRIALVGPTLHDVREVMIEGPSGLCAIGPETMRPTYEVTRRRLVWPKTGACAGAVAFAFSAEDPDSLRGPQFDLAWCDEIGAWANDVKTWNTLAFGMRLGPAPRIVATTTPRPRALVKRLAEKAERARGGVVVTRASTRENAANLSPDFVAGLEEDYAGTELGRQEIDGELIEDVAGALWSRAMIEASRVGADGAEGLARVVVAVDPPAGASGRSDACGIIVAGVKEGVVYVLQDATVRGLMPAEWAARVVSAARGWGAAWVVAESNQGGEMVRDVLQNAGALAGVGRLRVKLRHAAKSKGERAEPVSTLYAGGKVRHVRVLKELEDEMCAFGTPGDDGRRAGSPDRVDALVWAVDELLRKPVRPKVVNLLNED